MLEQIMVLVCLISQMRFFTLAQKQKKAHCLTTLNDIKAAQADRYHLLLMLYLEGQQTLQLSLQSAHLHLMEHEILHNQQVANYQMFDEIFIHGVGQNKAGYTNTRCMRVGRGHFLGHLIIWAGAVRPKTAKTQKSYVRRTD